MNKIVARLADTLIGSAFFALIFLALSNRFASAQVVLYENDFNIRAAGPYTDDDLDEDWNDPRFNNGVTEGRVSIVSGDQAFGGTGSALAVTYPAGLAGPGDTGAQWSLELDVSVDELYLSYRVQFGSGFDFVRGGKLPGLAGGTSPTGSTQATGLNGWTGRMMWRTDFNGVSGEPEQPTAFGIEYAKHTTSGFAQDGRQEDDTPFTAADGGRVEYVSGQWYEITQRIQMNTPGQFDGIQQVWVDGELVYNETDLQFRTTDQFAIDQLYFSTFFGGNDDWATSKDEVVYFDDFLVFLPETGGPGGDPDDGTLTVPGDYATLTEALEAAEPEDTILVSGVLVENVVVDQSVIISGESGATLMAADSNAPTITINANDVSIENLGIAGGSIGICALPRSENVLLNGLFITEANSHGCDVARLCTGFTAIDCEFRENGDEGMRMVNTDEATLQGNFSNRNGRDGFRITHCDDVMFTENKAFQNEANGFRLSGNSHSLIENQSLDNDGRGFSVTYGNDHYWLDNLAKDNQSHGYNFDALVHSQLLDNRARFNDSDGFRFLKRSDFNTIDDSNSTGNGRNGMLLVTSSGNEIVNSFVLENGRHGLVLNRTSSFNSVSGNIFDTNARQGIVNSGSDNEIAEDNIVR